MTATVDLVDYLLATDANPSPRSAAAARSLVLDVLGVAAAGAMTDEGRTVLAAMRRLGRAGSGNCSVPATTDTFDAATSALLTGTMAYSIGLTDTHAESITHPGPSIVPAALAAGQSAGASDERVLAAIVMGVEAVVRIGTVVNPSHRARGFHPTGTCNVFGAAVAATYALGGSRGDILCALGISGSLSSGIYEFRNEGSMVMALHGGWPSGSGVTAAFLATSGFTGPSTIIEGPEGFVRAFSDVSGEVRILPAGPARPGIEELSMRPYCACRYAHAAIDALERIRAGQRSFDADEIAKITVWTHKTAVDQECEPTTLVSARLSSRFTVAQSAIRGPQLTEISAADLRDPQIAGVYERVEILEDPELTALFPRIWACRVELLTTDGARYVEYVDAPKGDPSNPLTDDEIREKFDRLAVPSIGPAAARTVADVILGADPSHDLASVLGLMTSDTLTTRTRP
jgi:2-methylcitrate dehydratase PrpD